MKKVNIPGLLLLTVVATPIGSPAQDDRAKELQPGLIGEFYSFGVEMNDFPTLGDHKPVLRLVDPRVDFEMTLSTLRRTGLRDYFYARWTGILRVPKEGTYGFKLESDDGSRLRIDGKLVVDNGGLHPPHTRAGTADLKAGDHEIRVDLFENDGYVGCKLYWEGAGLPLQVVPASAFFHRPDKSGR